VAILPFLPRCCDEDFNKQTFIGHIKEFHDLLQSMYEAIVPRDWKEPAPKNLAENLPEPQLISHLLPWLPGAQPPLIRLRQPAGGFPAAPQPCDSVELLRLDKTGLAIKNPPKKNQKNRKKCFYWFFFKFFNFFMKIIQTFLFETDFL
jgi:hypothetical protein